MTYAVATGHSLTTEAAVETLKAGGTAVDAAIAAACMAFVVEPVLAGPLGGGFLMTVAPEGRTMVLDAFVDTPSHRIAEGDLDLDTIEVDFGTTSQTFHIGAGTTASPCLMPALWEAQAQAGRLPWRDLVAPACKAARDGVALNAFQAHLNGLVRPILTASPEVEELFAPAAEPGALRKNPDLADVLEVFAAEGPRFFTEGEVGQALLSLPGQVLTAGDLTRATGIWRKPLRTYCGHAEVSLNPAPSLGGVLIAMALNLAPTDAGPAEIAAAFEAVARARVDLALDQAADPEAVGLDPHLLRGFALEALPKVAEEVGIERKAATRGTTHISVIASDGSGAALTLSNGEGCGRLVPGTGIQPNNMLGEEDLNPAGPTGWTPQQRLASMMCPASLRQPDGALTLLGSGGSARIRTALPRVMRALVHGTPPEEAIALPRIHAEPGRIDFEDIGGEAFRAAILDHFPEATPWPEPSMFFGGVHIAQAGPNGARAAGDPRRAGAAETS